MYKFVISWEDGSFLSCYADTEFEAICNIESEHNIRIDKKDVHIVKYPER